MDPISAVSNLVGNIINKIFPDKEEAAKANLKLLELQQSGQLKEIEIAMSAIIAEAQSQDKWTSRARPSFLYVMYVMILFSIPIGILSVFNMHAVLQIEEGFKGWLSAIPTALWELFGGGYLGYLFHASYDKKQILNGKNKL